MASLSERGDLVAVLPGIPAAGPASSVAHSDQLRLLSRRVLGPVEWSAKASWKVRVEGELGERVVTTVAGKVPSDGDTLKVLGGGEALPSTFPESDELLSEVAADAKLELGRLRAEAQIEVDARSAEERARLERSYDEQIEELKYRLEATYSEDRAYELQGSIAELERARDVLLGQAKGEAEVRADLLAVKFFGSPQQFVEDIWVGPSGRQATLVGRWSPRSRQAPSYEVDGERVRLLEMCDEGHLHDQPKGWVCPICGSRACRLCGPLAGLRSCSMCGAEGCGKCVPRSTNLCRRCSDPARAPELDFAGARGWTLGDGVAVLVGTGATVVVRNGVPTEIFDHFPTQGCSPAVWSRRQKLAELLGSRVDLTLVHRSAPRRPVPPRQAVAFEVVTTRRWSAQQEGASGDGFSEVALTVLPEADGALPVGAASGAFQRVIKTLQAHVPPTEPPQVKVETVYRATWLEFRADGVRTVARDYGPDGPGPVREAPLGLEVVSGPEHPEVLARARLAPRGFGAAPAELVLCRGCRRRQGAQGVLRPGGGRGDGGLRERPGHKGTGGRSARAAAVGAAPGAAYGLCLTD